MTARYQRGNLSRKTRKKGPDVWEFRWYDDSGKLRSKLIGTVEKYPSKKDAERATDALRLEINSELPQAVPITVDTLIDRYFGDSVEMGRLAFSTRKSYETYLKGYIRPKWGSFLLEEVRTMAVELWLRNLKLAPKTKVHIRNLMHVLFECAVRWEIIRDNPISRVRQGGARRSDPDVLTPQEFKALLGKIEAEPYRTMVVLAGCLGLSRSEIVGLKWSDINWIEKTLTISRGVVCGHVGNPKTLARQKPIPLADEIVRILQNWRTQTAYTDDSDWVFASPRKHGAKPYWPDSALKKAIQPAVAESKLAKKVGWHTFRHSYSTLLRANGTDVKVQQELLRHSNAQTTLNVYTQAVSEKKREAHTIVVGQLL